MDERRADSLTDSALDREVQAALTVDPSPEFLARVRMRVASEPAPAAWTLSWAVLAGGAAVATLVVAVVVSNAGRSGNVEPHDDTPTNLRGAATVAAPAPVAPRVVRQPASERPLRVVRAEPPRAAADAPPFPEVLISTDEVRAYEAFVAAVQQRRIPPMPAIEENRPTTSTGLPDIDIAPLVLAPLPQIARLEIGERQ